MTLTAAQQFTVNIFFFSVVGAQEVVVELIAPVHILKYSFIVVGAYCDHGAHFLLMLFIS